MMFLIIFVFYFVKVNSADVQNSEIFPLPYFNNVSPCPCDLTEEKCDTKCCCDQVQCP